MVVSGNSKGFESATDHGGREMMMIWNIALGFPQGPPPPAPPAPPAPPRLRHKFEAESLSNKLWGKNLPSLVLLLCGLLGKIDVPHFSRWFGTCHRSFALSRPKDDDRGDGDG